MQYKKCVAGILGIVLLGNSMIVQAAELMNSDSVFSSNHLLSIAADNSLKYNYTVNDELVSPLQQTGELLACFGENRVGYYHSGVDVRAAEGTPVYAIKSGIITKAAPDSKGVNAGGGNMIFIDHQDGTQSRYMHLRDYEVQEGDFVEAGTMIAHSGCTGDSSTPHLHLEYYIDGIAVDPAFIFELSGVFTAAMQQTEEFTDDRQNVSEVSSLEGIQDSFRLIQY